MSPSGKRVALVTGATSGIGFAVTRTLAEQGYGVFMCARSGDDVKRTSKELHEDGLDVHGTACDVTSTEDVRNFVAAAVQHFGRIDVLVNNAGRSGGGVTAQLSEELWNEVINTNLNSVFLVTAAGSRSWGSGRWESRVPASTEDTARSERRPNDRPGVRHQRQEHHGGAACGCGQDPRPDRVQCHRRQHGRGHGCCSGCESQRALRGARNR